jgi:hypothetical protein
MSSVAEAAVLQNKLEDPKSPLGVYDLPCGYLAEDGRLLTEIELGEITGHEEDILTSLTMPDYKKVGAVIGRCIKRIGDITDRGKIASIAKDLTIGDRTYVMFMLRRLSLGDYYPFRAVCPSFGCQAQGTYSVNLAELEIKKMPEPKKRTYEFELPRSKKMAVVRIATGATEEETSKIKGIDDKMSLNMLSKLELLDGKPPVMDDVKALPLMDRNFLRDVFDEIDGGVETDVELRCQECGREFTQVVDPGQRDFFFPSRQARNSKTNSST